MPKRIGSIGIFRVTSKIVIVPVFALTLAALLLATNLSFAIVSIANGGKIKYSDETFNNYVNEQYASEFGESSAYDDNLLIVFLTNQRGNGYYAMALAGKNLDPQIRQMFGGEITEFWTTLESSMTEYYKFSAQKGFRVTLEQLSASISDKRLESAFVTEQDHSSLTVPHVTNYSSLSINEDSVNIAIRIFTESTGIPTVMVIDTAENVFGKTMPVKEIVVSVISAAVITVSSVLIVKDVKKRRGSNGDLAASEAEETNDI